MDVAATGRDGDAMVSLVADTPYGPKWAELRIDERADGRSERQRPRAGTRGSGTAGGRRGARERGTVCDAGDVRVRTVYAMFALCVQCVGVMRRDRHAPHATRLTADDRAPAARHADPSDAADSMDWEERWRVVAAVSETPAIASTADSRTVAMAAMRTSARGTGSVLDDRADAGDDALRCMHESGRM